MQFKGIHHVSAITADARRNVDFYTRILGLRLVKKTVNQDDPSVYHLFYGDELGSPGTEFTFFELPMAGRTREGNNSISATSLRVPSDRALEYWKERLDEYGVEREEILERAGRWTLAFRDFEGQRIILVSDEHNSGVAGGVPWDKSPVPAEYSIIGLGPVQLTVPNAKQTVRVLTELMGFRHAGQYPSQVEGQPDIVVYETGEGGTGAEVHIEERTDLPQERLGRGGVHHVAFRTEDEEELRQWIQQITAAGFAHSGDVDRFYFRSLYFREPNGILFELATDGPGFDTDEPLEHLGESLALPPFLEPKREEIEAQLRPLDTSL
ncbi:ring-cleaving dioxygenase [Paenibacillus cisolokensis]|uniref:ring-cleaving dioxygenase n=1 Tax=Paenibacillus cisolokensis TaxID=1658519 RepID=UPI003D2AA59D